MTTFSLSFVSKTKLNFQKMRNISKLLSFLYNNLFEENITAITFNVFDIKCMKIIGL